MLGAQTRVKVRSMRKKKGEDFECIVEVLVVVLLFEAANVLPPAFHLSSFNTKLIMSPF